MKIKLLIKGNKVYMVRWFFFKFYIGKYFDGDILILNKNLIDKLKEDNSNNMVLRDSF